MTVSIVIEGSEAQLIGNYPLDLVTDLTSYYKQGYQFMPRYLQGVWDGRIRLFNKRRRTFPAGLVVDVCEGLRSEGIKVQVDDRRSRPAVPPNRICELQGVSFEYPYDFQLEAVDNLIAGQRGIAAVATNGGKTEIACLVAANLRLPTLFCVPGKELLYQTQKRFAKRLGIPLADIGIIGDSVFNPNPWITIGIVASIYSRISRKHEPTWNLLTQTELLFLDECHRTGSESWYQVAKNCDAFFRYGLSGTPLKRTDGADMRLLSVTGPVLYEIRNKQLIERGISSEVEIQMLPIREPVIPKGTPYKDAYKAGIVENVYRNEAIVSLTGDFKGLGVVVLVKEIAHGDELSRRLAAAGSATHKFIHGGLDSEIRQQALADFENNKIAVLIATSILDEGVDVPNIDVLILAGGGKSSIKTLQRVGRGIRMGGTGHLIVVDFVDYLNKYLLEHSYQRFQDFKEENCFKITQISL